jgi:hypothetical protein
LMHCVVITMHAMQGSSVEAEQLRLEALCMFESADKYIRRDLSGQIKSLLMMGSSPPLLPAP